MIRKLLPACALLSAPAFAFALSSQSVSLDKYAPADISVADLTEDCAATAKSFRVTIRNNSDRPVAYTATATALGGVTVVRTLAVPSNASRYTDITATIEPGETPSWGYSSVKFSGPGTTGSSSASFSAHTSSHGYSSGYSAPRQIAMSPQLHTNFAARLKTVYETRSTPAAFAQLDPYAISGDWRTLRAFDSVVLTGDDWRIAASRPESREALLRYAGQGGRLRILAKDGETPPALPGTGDRQHYGFGLISVFRSDAEQAVKDIEAAASGGFDSKNPFNTGSLWDTGATAPVGDTRYRALDKLLPAAAKAGIGIMIIVILFAIVVGPVNLFWLCRGTRRHRMLWLTPAIALGTSLLLSGYIVVADGTGGEGHRRRLRLRPAGANSEFLVQEQSSRTGLLLGTGFDIPTDALLWNQPAVTSPGHSGRRSFSGMREESEIRDVEGHGAGDWFKSRFAQAQTLEMWDAARGGLTLAGKPEAPEVVSSLDGTLDRVFVIDAAGRTWSAEHLAPGAKVALKPAGENDLKVWLGEVKRTSGYTQVKRLEALDGRRGQYFAECKNLRASAPETLESIRWENLPDIIVGDIAQSGGGVPPPEKAVP